ncbi:MAG: alanine racemase, partial [Desulfamplus sp.]|nr:alanine racemase [Desulfamplus sp.]
MNSKKSSLMPVSRLCVDLKALAGNLKALKGQCSPDILLMAVVKANAYGHGAVPVAKTALANGASFLAVARVHEALELREAGISAPLLLFGDVDPSQVEWLSSHDVRVSLGSFEVAREIAGVAYGCGHELKVHIKVDTGMGRLGVVIPD